MASTRRSQARIVEADEPTMDIASLIDIAFLLLIYFLVTSTLQPKEADLGMNLPSHTMSKEQKKIAHAHIKVNPDNSILFNTELVDSGQITKKKIPALWDRLYDYKKTLEATGDQPLVVIQADDKVTQQRFVDVLNCVAGVGIKEVTLTGFGKKE